VRVSIRCNYPSPYFSPAKGERRHGRNDPSEADGVKQGRVNDLGDCHVATLLAKTGEGVIFPAGKDRASSILKGDSMGDYPEVDPISRTG
jgi:hypothetical protein